MNSETSFIPLSGGKAHAIVDACSFDFISQWDWCFSSTGYAYRTVTFLGKPTLVLMHRVIACPPDNALVDHINRNKLDNRLCNLRFATTSGNNTNRGPNWIRRHGIEYKGVYKNGKWPTYAARMTIKEGEEQKHLYLGSFKTQEEAAMAYDIEAFKRFGDFSKLNFPERIHEYSKHIEST